MRRHRLIPARALLTLATLCACGLGAVQAASGDQPVRPLPQASAPAKTEIQERKTSLPAKGLFVGDQLSAAAKDKLTELILNALGLHVQVAEDPLTCVARGGGRALELVDEHGPDMFFGD